MANQFQEMIDKLNSQNRKADEGARRGLKPPPGTRRPEVHPTVALHCHPRRAIRPMVVKQEPEQET